MLPLVIIILTYFWEIASVKNHFIGCDFIQFFRKDPKSICKWQLQCRRLIVTLFCNLSNFVFGFMYVDPIGTDNGTEGLVV